MKLLALIPARGGSKGIARKNIKPLAGKPLIDWSIRAARQAARVAEVVVSSEDAEIIEVARRCGASVPFVRPDELARDDTPSMAAVMHALDQLPHFDWVILLQPTSPLRTAADIDDIVQYCIDRDAPAAVSVCSASKHPYWMYRLDASNRLQPMMADSSPIYCRQDLPPAYVLNGSMYLAQRDWLYASQQFVGPNTLGYVMPADRSVDLDTDLDWQWVEFLIERGYGK